MMRRARLLALLIVLLAFGLRLYELADVSLRGDESFTVLFVQKPLEQMWAETLTVEPNPPLLYFTLRGWLAGAGAGEFAARYYSLFLGVLCVPLLYRLAREIFSFAALRHPPSAPPAEAGVAVGLVAAFLIAINPYQIWHSQDVRNYTLWVALSLLSLGLFWRWLRSGRMVTLSGFVAAELAALYTHYYEVFILLALNLFVLFTVRERRRLAAWFAAQAALALFYLPYPLILSNRVAEYGEGSGRMGVALWEIARSTFSSFTLGETLDDALRAWLWVPLAVAVAASWLHLARRDRTRALFFVLYLGVPTLAVFALNLVRPLFLERYLNAIAPGYYLLLAFGITSLAGAPVFQRRRWSRAALAAGLACTTGLASIALVNYWTNPAFAKAPPWRELAAVINTRAQPGDIIVQNFPETSLLYYDRSRLPLVVYPETFFPDEGTPRALSALNANYQRIWFIPAAPDYWDPEQYVEAWLDQRDDLRDEVRVGSLRLKLYDTPSRYLNTMARVGAAFGDAMTLLGYRMERRGSDLRVVLIWRAQTAPERDYVVRLQAMDADGAALSAVESIPVRGAAPTSSWRKNQIIVDQHDLPNGAGAANVRVSVCDGDACLRVKGGEGLGEVYPRELEIPTVE